MKSAGAYPVSCPLKVNEPRGLLTAARPVASRRNSAPAITLCAPWLQLICSESCTVLSF